MTIQVGEPNTSEFNAITPVKLTDLKSKFGTEVNKESLGRGSKSFDCPRIELQLGPSTSVHLVWKPINITYGTGERNKAHELMWEQALSVLGPLDIKLSASFSAETTHYLKGAHRTSKLALALVSNLPILSVDFLEVIKSIAHILEQDFRQWPDESQFLEDPLWAPNPGRSTCFKGQRFVVYEENQFINLDPVIGAAGGTISLVKPNAQIESSAILIKPQDKSLLKHTTASLYTANSDILHAIKVARPVVPVESSGVASQARGTSQASEASKRQTETQQAPSNSRKRPQKAGMMDFLTQTPHQPTSQSTQGGAPGAQSAHSLPVKQESQDEPTSSLRKRPARVTMMDFMVGKRQKIDTETKAESQPGSVTHSNPQRTDYPVENIGSESKKQRIENNSSDDGDALFVREVTSEPLTREPSNALEPSTEPEGESVRQKEPSIAPFVDLDTNISGLALVECTLSIAARAQKSASLNPEWQRKPNFKAFRRKSDRRASIKGSQNENLSLGVGVFPGSQPVPVKEQARKISSPEVSFIDDVDRLPSKEHDPDADNEFGFKFTS